MLEHHAFNLQYSGMRALAAQQGGVSLHALPAVEALHPCLCYVAILKGAICMQHDSAKELAIKPSNVGQFVINPCSQYPPGVLRSCSPRS